MATTKAKQADQEEAIATLRELLAEHEVVTLWCNLKQVASSGMSRVISLHFVDKQGGIRNISHLAHRILAWRYNDRHEGLSVSGCGMDMGFHTVYELSSALYNGQDRPGYLPSRPGGSTGYWLEHRWI
jgi:hypothetical protein